MTTITFALNGEQRAVNVDDPQMPLLYAIDKGGFQTGGEREGAAERPLAMRRANHERPVPIADA